MYLFSTLFHYDLLQNIEYSSLCYTVGPCSLSILYHSICNSLYLLIPNSPVLPSPSRPPLPPTLAPFPTALECCTAHTGRRQASSQTMGQAPQAAARLPEAPRLRASHLREDPPGLWVMSPEPRGPSEAVLTNKTHTDFRIPVSTQCRGHSETLPWS